MDNTRITRVPLPIDLIRQMDEAIILGTGGYTTRTELIVDSIRERLLELGHETAPPLELSPAQVETPPSTEEPPNLNQTGLSKQSEAAATDPLSLAGVDSTTCIGPDEDISRPEGVPLFGMHNRDYPSMWALRELALICVDGPVPLEQFWDLILPKAWEHGERLAEYQKATGVKSTALFPTNRSKTKAAEAAFRTFAVGSVSEEADAEGSLTTSGPLFEWHAAGLKHSDDGVLVGPTPAGWALIRRCSMITVLEPHQADATHTFVAHLAAHAPADHHALHTILRILASGDADRRGVLEKVAQTWSTWSESQVSTNSAGYIARAREWGLVEPKQVNGSYLLTELGESLLTKNTESNTERAS